MYALTVEIKTNMGFGLFCEVALIIIAITCTYILLLRFKELSKPGTKCIIILKDTHIYLLIVAAPQVNTQPRMFYGSAQLQLELEQ